MPDIIARNDKVNWLGLGDFDIYYLKILNKLEWCVGVINTYSLLRRITVDLLDIFTPNY